MLGFLPLLVFAGSAAGILIGLLLAWQLLLAVLRLALATHTTSAVSLLLGRLAAATRQGRGWEGVLRGLRLEMPWPWPWRLDHAADRLAEGEPPAEVLAGSALLPDDLRLQAAQALRQGPAAFTRWSEAIADRQTGNPLAVRQQAFLLAEFAALAAMLWFLSTFVFPKFEYILRDLNVAAPPLIAAFSVINRFGVELLAAAAFLAIGLWSWRLSLRWRSRRRLAAGQLLLAGVAAQLPEAALGGGDDGSFAAACAAAGWRAADPAELARLLARAEEREVLRDAWLPALAAAAAPIAAAVPIGLVIIGIMQVLLTILASVEATT